MLLTKENYFFKGGTQAALVKLMYLACEGQFAEGKVIGNLLKHLGNNLSPLCLDHAYKPVLQLTFWRDGIWPNSHHNKETRKETANLIKANTVSEFSEF